MLDGVYLTMFNKVRRAWVLIVASHVNSCCIKSISWRRELLQPLTQRVICTLPSSNYPLSKLSPSSQKTRIGNIMIDRKNSTRKLNCLQQFDCTVSDKQHAKLLEFFSSVHKNGSKVIKELMEEGSRVLGDKNVL